MFPAIRHDIEVDADNALDSGGSLSVSTEWKESSQSHSRLSHVCFIKT